MSIIHKNGSATCALTCLDVVQYIADKTRSIQCDAALPFCTNDQTSPRLAAVTLLNEINHYTLGMTRAVIELRHGCAGVPEQSLELSFNLGQRRLGKTAQSETRLFGNRYEAETGRM